MELKNKCNRTKVEVDSESSGLCMFTQRCESLAVRFNGFRGGNTFPLFF